MPLQNLLLPIVPQRQINAGLHGHTAECLLAPVEFMASSYNFPAITLQVAWESYRYCRELLLCTDHGALVAIDEYHPSLFESTSPSDLDQMDTVGDAHSDCLLHYLVVAGPFYSCVYGGKTT
jgi:hypothetical protein